MDDSKVTPHQPTGHIKIGSDTIQISPATIQQTPDTSPESHVSSILGNVSEKGLFPVPIEYDK